MVVGVEFKSPAEKRTQGGLHKREAMLGTPLLDAPSTRLLLDLRAEGEAKEGKCQVSRS